MDSMTEVTHLKCLVATFALMHKMEIGEVSLEDFRSISLIKSVCKILAEALASRLRRRPAYHLFGSRSFLFTGDKFLMWSVLLMSVES